MIHFITIMPVLARGSNAIVIVDMITKDVHLVPTTNKRETRSLLKSEDGPRLSLLMFCLGSFRSDRDP